MSEFSDVCNVDKQGLQLRFCVCAISMIIHLIHCVAAIPAMIDSGYSRNEVSNVKLFSHVLARKNGIKPRSLKRTQNCMSEVPGLWATDEVRSALWWQRGAMLAGCGRSQSSARLSEGYVRVFSTNTGSWFMTLGCDLAFPVRPGRRTQINHLQLFNLLSLACAVVSLVLPSTPRLPPLLLHQSQQTPCLN